MPRDDFTRSVKDQLAKRVAWHCSNPNCHSPTTGPRADSGKSVSIGVAAHIHAASEGGARYKVEQNSLERASAENGMWVCQSCAKLVDNDSVRFTAELLLEWKQWAENWALGKLRGTTDTNDSFQQIAGGVAPMSNQPTPALACLEHLRLENIQAPWSEMEPMFTAARIMTDGAGVRLGWNVVELHLESEDMLPNILDSFASATEALSKKYRLVHNLLAVVVHGGNSGQNESLAIKAEEFCNRSNGHRGIRVLIGYMAGNRFVDKIFTPA